MFSRMQLCICTSIKITFIVNLVSAVHTFEHRSARDNLQCFTGVRYLRVKRKFIERLPLRELYVVKSNRPYMHKMYKHE